MKAISSERWQQIDALFAAALELPTTERDAFLESSCRNDPGLCSEVKWLLGRVDAAGSRLGESAWDSAASIVAGLRTELEREELTRPPKNERIGPYRILREIGRGGMGTVYLAERADEQFDKRVALKLVKRGMDTDEVLRRFRYERQILAVLEHPNIARLYDGGATEDGRPYLVMEYIEGQSITEYCDERRLPIRDRLRLFETVCGAVQFAHQNLVIHRDIKPSNILVTADGAVKLLDFGIAKLLDPAAPGAPQTRPELRLLTPEYAAPEQIDGAAVTTASDVYALGVVLYELLTGRHPLQHQSHRSLERPRAEREIDRPSTAVARPVTIDTGEREPPSPTEVAARRSTTPQRLYRHLRGDLDTIVLKALADEPERRYQSAEQLLADIQRYLQGQPVVARGDSVLYRTGKFVRRHRVGVSFAAVLAILVVSFAATMAVQADRIERARAVAVARQGQAEDLIGFMLGDLRTQLEPIGRLDLLDGVGAKALEYFAAVPESELSNEELFRRSEALSQLGQVRFSQGEMAEAEEAFRQSFTLAQGLAARDPTNDEWKLGLGNAHFWLGYIAWRQGDFDRALEQFLPYLHITEQLVEREPDNLEFRLELANANSTIGSVQESRGDLESALEAFQAARAINEDLVRRDSANLDWKVDLAHSNNTIAVVQRKTGDLRGAAESHRAELSLKQDLAAADPANRQWQWYLAIGHAYFGDLLMALGEPGAALTEFRESHRIYRALVAHDSSNSDWRRSLANTERLLGGALLEHRDARNALQRLDSSRSQVVQFLASNPENRQWQLELARTEIALSKGLLLAGRPTEALAAAHRALAVLQPAASLAPDAMDARRVVSEAHLQLGEILTHIGDEEAARLAWIRALETVDSLARASRHTDLLALSATALLHLDRIEEATPLVHELEQRGYRRLNFVDLARTKGVIARISASQQLPARIPTRSL